MDAPTLLLFLAGFVLLVIGAEFLVRGASRLARAAGISPLVVGLTVVALGTSSPELAVSIGAAMRGQADLAIGNVVGSNIFNVLLILGLAASITPLLVQRRLVQLDVPVMIAASLLPLLFGWNGRISRLEGALFVAGAVGYTAWLVLASRRERGGDARDEVQEPGSGAAGLALQGLLIVAGLALLVLGSRWLVGGAVAIARWMGLSELIIGLTILAAGTSLPEVAASVVAAIRGERDIAVGNVVGSNILNILTVLGASAVVAPGGIAVAPSALAFDIPVMIGVAVACLPVFFTGHLIARWEGTLFLGYYLAYTAYLFLDAVEHDHLETFGLVVGWFVLPLTVVTLGIGAARAMRHQGSSRPFRRSRGRS